MLSTVIGLGRLFLDTAKMVFPENNEIGSAAIIAEKAGYTYNILTNSSSNKALATTLVAPVVGVDKSIIHSPYMNTLMRVVAASDIQAVLTHIRIKNAEELGIKIGEIIGSIQPARSGLLSLSGNEALTLTGPSIEGIEANKPDDKKIAKNDDGDDVVTIDGKAVDYLTEFTPLAVGRTVMVTVRGKGDVKVPIPLVFREKPLTMSPKQLEHIFSAGRNNTGLKARITLYSGEEVTGAQLLSGSDIVKEKFLNRNEDMTGYYEEMNRRERTNKVEALRTGVMSMNTLANTFIISSSTARQIELKIGRSFNSRAGVEKIFEVIKASRIIICRENDMLFTFIDASDYSARELTLKDIEMTAKKADGSDTLEKLTQLLMGR